MSPTGKTKLLPPAYPNAGIEAEYYRRLTNLIEEMHRSLIYWIGVAYRQNEPEISNLALDASPAKNLDAVIRRLARRWLKRFNALADDLARWFAQSAQNRSETVLKAALKKSGIAIKFTLTPAANDALQATIAENVGLIRSIPQQHLTAVQGHVMRSIQAGGDLGTLTKVLINQFGSTKRRAALIARDQNHKATAVITRVRQLELGLTKARWVHSGIGREPRPSHVKASQDKVIYDVAKGWWDPHEKKFIWPGTLINCHCTSRPVMEG